jgi:hypothetical protein
MTIRHGGARALARALAGAEGALPALLLPLPLLPPHGRALLPESWAHRIIQLLAPCGAAAGWVVWPMRWSPARRS